MSEETWTTLSDIDKIRAWHEANARPTVGFGPRRMFDDIAALLARVAELEAEDVRLRERDAAEADEMISWIESLEYSRPFETRQAQIGVLAAVVEELRKRYLNEDGGTK